MGQVFVYVAGASGASPGHITKTCPKASERREDEGEQDIKAGVAKGGI